MDSTEGCENEGKEPNDQHFFFISNVKKKFSTEE